MTMQEQPDGSLRVCLTEDGITACFIVDSMHVAYQKEPQLRAAIRRQAMEAMDLG